MQSPAQPTGCDPPVGDSPGQAVPADQPRRFRGWRARTLLLIGSILLALGVCEIVVRVSGVVPTVLAIGITSDHTAFRRSTNPILAFELKPNFRDPQPNNHSTYRHTNAFGQRDRQREVAKRPGTSRVIVLGDSVVEGLGLPSLHDTIPLQLEQQYSDGSIEALNFGVTGYCTRAEVELLRVKGLQFNPDLVIVVFVENDFKNFNPEAFQLALKRSAWLNSAFRTSSLFRLVCLRFNLFGFGLEFDPIAHHTEAIGDNNVVGGLQLLNQLSKKHSFRTLIAVWPSFLDDRIVDVHAIPDDDGRLVIEGLATAMGLPVVRLSPFFRKHRADNRLTNPRLAYTTGDMMHPSQRGCQVAASALKEIIDDWTTYSASPADTSDGSLNQKPASSAIEAARLVGSRYEPTYYRVKVNLGCRAMENDDHPRAIQLFREAASLEPLQPEAYYNLGNVYQAAGQLDAASRAYRQAADCDPLHFPSRYNLGVILAQAGDLDAAISQFQAALQVKPDLADAHFNIGAARQVQNRFADAKRHFQLAIQLQPAHTLARERLRQIRLRELDPDQTR